MNISQMKSWGQQAEEEAVDRVYYEALDLQESSDRLRNVNVVLMQENLSLREQLQEGRRVVGEFMGCDQSRTDQINHLAKQVVRLQKENEQWKSSHASLMELNKQCAQSNVDIHEQFEAVKYKLKCTSTDFSTKLTAWADANGVLTKEKESLTQKVEHLRVRNVDLEKKVRDLNCIAAGGFACGGCVACRLDNAEKVIDKLNWQIIKLQKTEAAHRKVMSFQNNLIAMLKEIVTRISELPWYKSHKDCRILANDVLKTGAAIAANIDRELEELRKSTGVIM